MTSLPLRVAACHVSPVFLSAKKTTQKVMCLIEEAAAQEANLVVFPETFIPAFPIWSALRPPTENHEAFKQMATESIYADGEEMRAIRAAAKKLSIMVSIGFSEKVRFSSATLYNSNIFIDNQGEPVMHHRKLVATFFEKLTWAPGDGYGLRVVETPFGRIGNLICGENTNPLARYALIAQGEQVHISTWPCIWPTRIQSTAARPTETQWPRTANYDNVAANRMRAAAHCFEAKCFGVLCSGALGDDAVKYISTGLPHLRPILEQSQRASTMFLDPTGSTVEGFTFNERTRRREPATFLQTNEGILYADLNVEDCIEGKQYHDIAGGYQRLDVFDFKVNRTRQHPATFIDDNVTCAAKNSGSSS